MVSVPVVFRARLFAGFWFRSVVGSALSAGAVSWSVGSSSRSFSGSVVRASFSSSAAAGAFACCWARRCRVSCCVRSVGGLWVVSVPCLCVRSLLSVPFVVR